MISQEQALIQARLAADAVSKSCNHSPLAPAELRQIAYVEALRLLAPPADTVAAKSTSIMYRSCRTACVRALIREANHQRAEEDDTESIRRGMRGVLASNSWAHVQREALPDAKHVTCYTWSFRIAGGTPEYLKRAINKLPLAQRESVELVYLQGLTQCEAAQRLHISQQAVGLRLRSAKKDLTQKLTS